MTAGGASCAASRAHHLSRSDKELFYRLRRIRRRDAERSREVLPIAGIAFLERSRVDELSVRCGYLECVVVQLLDRVHRLETSASCDLGARPEDAPREQMATPCFGEGLTTTGSADEFVASADYATASADGVAASGAYASDQQTSSATTLQRAWRAVRERHRRVGMATRIQAAWRVSHARQACATLRSERATAAVLLQRKWRARMKSLPRRVNIWDAAVEGADLRMRRIQRTWRGSRLRRVLAARRQVPEIYDFMPGLFAKLAFAASFILPAAREVPKMKDCAELPYMLGLAWARARRRMAIIGAPEVDSHGYELEDSLRDSVMYVLTSNGFTVRELKEFLPRVEHEYLSIYRGVRSTGNAYRLYLQRVHFMSEEEADRKVAEAVAEVVRLQRTAQH